VSLEQGAALIIGQNIGTASSSALAAIGAGVTAKRLALAYVLFKVIAALIAVIAFPFTAALMRTLLASVDGVTLLAAYHTAYNVVGVAVLLPATQWFTRTVERILPSKQTALQRALDPSALATPVIAVEAARRVIAHVLTTTATAACAVLSNERQPAAPDTAESASALEGVWDFLSELKEPPGTEVERLHQTSTLHALDHASRLAEVLADGGLPAATGVPSDLRAVELGARAMRAAQVVGGSITSESALSPRATSIGWSVSSEVAAALAELERAATELNAHERDSRARTLASVAPGTQTAADALAQIDAVRRLDRIAHHAWRSAAHLVGARQDLGREIAAGTSASG
jgi:phosphate:Na+ symporter